MAVDSFWSRRYPHTVWGVVLDEFWVNHMSEDYISTPIVVHSWCPGCHPERDPLTELLETQWCGDHRPSDRGDVEIEFKAWDEKPEFDNNGACDLIHRGRLPGDTKTP